MAAGQSVDPLSIETNQLLAPTHPTASQALKKPSAIGGSPPVGLRPPYGPPPMALSHPDCRCSLSLIVGGHSAEDLLEMTKETLEQVVPALTKVKPFLEAVAARVSCIPLPGLTEIPDLSKLTEEDKHE